MSCPPLSGTGVPVTALIAVAGLCLAAGLAVLVLARARRGRGATTITVLLLVLISGALTTGIGRMPSAHAATPCTAAAQPSNSSSSNTGGVAATGAASLTITQTSTMTGLAPGVVPTVITGVVTNRGVASTLVAAVTVRIATVIEASAAAPGACDASDYVLLDASMPVGRTLAPGQSAAFTGARIGFSDKAVNQDACQRAVVRLRYVSS